MSQDDLRDQWFRYVFHGKVDEIKELVKGGFDVDTMDDDGSGNVLTLACEKGFLEIVQVLLDAGVDLNVEGLEQTPLMLAGRKNYTDIMKLLIENGADLNGKDRDGVTPLMFAKEEAAKVLIEHGADVNAKNNDGRDALLIALSIERTSTAILLLENGAKATKEHMKKASEKNAWDVVKLLVDQGMDGNNCMDDWRDTPLKLACRAGRMDIVKALVNNGTDVNEGEGGKPFDSACRNGHVDIARFLVENGAEVDLEGSQAAVSLTKASEEGYLDIVRLMVDMGVEVNGRDDWGKTALIEACRRGHADCVRLLLNHGADVNAKDTYRMTAMDWAREEGHEEIVKILEDHPKKWCKEDHWSYQNGFKDAVKEVMLMWMHDQYDDDDDELNGFEWNMLPWEVIERILGWLGVVGKGVEWGKSGKKREREMDEVEKEEDEEETQPERKKRRNEEWKSP